MEERILSNASMIVVNIVSAFGCGRRVDLTYSRNKPMDSKGDALLGQAAHVVDAFT